MGKHRSEDAEGEFSDEQLDRIWEEMEEESDEDPEDS